MHALEMIRVRSAFIVMTQTSPDTKTYFQHYSIVFDARADLTDLCVRRACKNTQFPLGHLRTRSTFNQLKLS